MSRHSALSTQHSALFDYTAQLARDAAAAVHRQDGRLCQCGHLMHPGRCPEANPIQSSPSAYAHAFCQCSRAKLMGEPGSCATGGCCRPSRVINGVATMTCEECWTRRERTIARGLETFDARRRTRRRAW